MSVNLIRFRVHTLDGSAHDVQIMPADRMRAERATSTELPPSQRGSREAHAETHVLLWLWCNAKRTGLTVAKFEDYADTVLEYERLDSAGNPIGEDEDAPEVESVDPTQPVGSTTAPSASPSTSAPSTSG